MKFTTLLPVIILSIFAIVRADEVLEPTRTTSILTPTISTDATILSSGVEPRAIIVPKIICETSDGSPFRPHVSPIVNLFRNFRRGQKCVQQKFTGNHCTRMDKFTSASIDICGPPMANIDCGSVGDLLDVLNNQCQKVINGKERVGGYIDFGNMQIVLYSEDRSTS